MSAGGLTFFATPGTITASVVVATLAIAISVATWVRKGRGRRVTLLELLRLTAVALLLVTWNQPEWVVEIEPENAPVVAVLWDASRSMETADVERRDEGGTTTLVSRAAAVAGHIAAATWEPLAGRAEVVLTPFSGAASTQPPPGAAAFPAPIPGEPAPAEASTDIATPLAALLERHATLRAALLVSDGDWNFGGSPAAVATRYRTRRIPIHVLPVGSAVPLPDLIVRSVDAPTIAAAGKGVHVPFTIESALAREVIAEVRLEDAGGALLGSTEVRIPATGSADGTVEWIPAAPGDIEVTVVLPPQPGELRTDNNRQSAVVRVREESLRVLVVESTPRWEYRFLRNALVRDPGVEVHTLLFHPDVDGRGGPGALDEFPEPAALSSYDVVFLGDVGIGNEALGEDGLTPEQAEHLAGLVRSQASGLVLIPGFRGAQATLIDSALGDLYPVILDPERPRGTGHRLPAALVLTEAGGKSLLTRFHPDPRENARVWEQLPGFQWYAPVVRARAGSTVLAVHERDEGTAGRIPLLVTRPHGTGKVLLFATDGAWRWREGVEDRYHYRFWGQVVRWMAYQRKLAAGETIRLFYTPERPEVGDRVTWHANAMDDAGAPVEGGEVTLRIESPGGLVDRVTLAEAPGEWGLYSGSSTLAEAGAHRLTVHCRQTARTLEAELVTRAVERERIGAPARPEVLEEIARLTRGEVIDRLDSMVAELAALPPPEPRLRRLQVWSHPIWGAALVALLGLFWVGRKWAGMI